MKVSIFNGFNFHYEMIGYVIDYFKSNILLDIYTPISNISIEWKEYYENVFNIKLNWYNVNDYDPANYDNIILLTDDDYSFKEEWLKNHSTKIICINHNGSRIRRRTSYHIGTRYFNLRPQCNWAIPSYQIINIEEKKKILKENNKINILMLGTQNTPHSENILISLFDNFDDIEFHIINRMIPYKYTKQNISIYQNCSVDAMISIAKKCDYILCVDYTLENGHINKQPIHNSMSSSVPLSFSIGCQLIIPSAWNDYYKFKSAITYDDMIHLNKETKLNDIYDELNEIILHRNNTFNNNIDHIKIYKDNTSVSILTNITSSDIDINILYRVIKDQTYKNIVEWVLIGNNININITDYDIPIKIIDKLEISYPSITEIPIKGKYIVWMEMDEYYRPDRVEKLVDNLNKSESNIIKTKNICIHDYKLNKTIITSIINTNSNLCHTLDYMINPKNIETIDIEPVYKFSSNYKQFFIITMLESIMDFSVISTDIKDIIPENYLYYYMNLTNTEQKDYDIVYFTGGHCIEWEPSDKSLGGSEQAIVNLSENWVKMGKSVAVYTKLKDSKEHTLNGVNYLNWFNFPFEKKIKKLIVWRHTGIMMLMNMNFEKPDELIVDFHDNFSYTLSHLNQKLLLEFMNKVNWFHVKSNYHKQCLEEYLGQNLNNIRVIMNGIRVSNFANNNNYVRNPYRLCYCSSYDRGLETILEKIWPYIYKKEPRAELHVYYGMVHMMEPLKSKLKMLLSQEGVMDHGRQPLDMIVREKYISSFHLYLNNNVAEIDCISIRESLVTGCIPLLARFGVFNERHGLMFNYSDKLNNDMYEMIATDIVSRMNDIKFMEDARNQLKLSNTIVDWNNVAKMWLQYDYLRKTKIFVIHYKKLVDRKKLILEQFNKYNITNFEFIEHYDRNDPINVNELSIFKENYDKTQICISLSHIYAFKEISEKYDEGLILEDDIILDDNFAEIYNNYLSELPKSYDFLSIGYGCGQKIDKILPNKNIYLKSDGYRLRCTDSYLINKKCVNKILNYIYTMEYKIDQPIDWFLDKPLKDLDCETYWAEPTIVKQGTIFGLMNKSY
jgi:GR25 family glycosyltransferase involved in LPS biosynthesis